MEVLGDNLEIIVIVKMKSGSREVTIDGKGGRPVFEPAIGCPFVSDETVCKDGKTIVGAGNNGLRVRHRVR